MEKILVTDIDSVLEDIMPTLNDFYNRTHGTNFRLEDYIYYDLERVWGGTKEEAVKAVAEFYESPDFDEIEPIEFSQEAISILSKKYRVISVTSRPEFTRERTEKKFHKKYPSIKKILFTGDYSKSYDKMSKLTICLMEGAEIIIDDHPLITLECSNHGLISLLFGEDWKRDNLFKNIKLNGVIPVKNWKKVLEHLI